MENIIQTTPIELLAPAHDKETAISAINHGADAVYIGADKFGAREKAGNSIQDIEKLIKYAHVFNVKVYATVNTIFFDHEAEQIRTLCRALWNTGVDAIIVQDAGIFELDLPPIRFHISTQANSRTLEKVSFWEKTGASRVILARELSLKQITEIRAKTNIEIEVFIHGALCVSYSGNCYMSYIASRRSANRGVCSQPCRLPYNLIDNDGKVIAKDKHLLSLCDLDASTALFDLITAGITSFKIEGRLKDSVYVKNTTAFYHSLINKFIEQNQNFRRPSKGNCAITFNPDVEKTFSRGHSTYFIFDRQRRLANFATPKSMGKYIGAVIKTDPEHFSLNTAITLANGDGVCFISGDRLIGTQIIGKDDKGFIPQEIKGIITGTKIFCNHDTEFIKQVEKSKTPRSRELVIDISETGSTYEMTADAEGYTYKHAFHANAGIAENQLRAAKIWKNGMLKSGHFAFDIKQVNINTSKLPHYPISKINELRRLFLTGLTSAILDDAYLNRPVSLINTRDYYEKRIDYQHNVSNRFARLFYKKRNVESIEPAIETSGSNRRKTDGITVMTTRYCILFELGLCLKLNKKHRIKLPLRMANDNREYMIEFDCDKCEMKISELGGAINRALCVCTFT